VQAVRFIFATKAARPASAPVTARVIAIRMIFPRRSGQDYLEKPLALYMPKPRLGGEDRRRLARWQALKRRSGLAISRGGQEGLVIINRLLDEHCSHCIKSIIVFNFKAGLGLTPGLAVSPCASPQSASSAWPLSPSLAGSFGAQKKEPIGR